MHEKWLVLPVVPDSNILKNILCLKGSKNIWPSVLESHDQCYIWILDWWAWNSAKNINNS